MLNSDAAAYINGVDLAVDGGFAAMMKLAVLGRLFRYVGEARHVGRVHAPAIDAEILRMAEMVQREGGVDRIGLALNVERLVHGLLGELQRKARLGGDLLRHLQREIGQRVFLHHMVNHAEPPGFLSGPAVGGEQKLLGLARPKLPWMSEPFDAGDAEGDDRIGEYRFLERR